MKNKLRLSQVYQKFFKAEGNQHIASEYAIRKLVQLIARFKTKSILEIGLGIGSISGTILEIEKGENLNYSGTETNAFCLESLNRNLGANFSKLNIYSGIKEIPARNRFDLIIIDGKDQDLGKIKDLLAKNGIIVIEGDRIPQQVLLEELFPNNKTVHSISLRKNSSGSPFPKEEWQGGLKIIFTDPTAGQKLWWVKEKILTKLKYKYPGRHFGSSKINVIN